MNCIDTSCDKISLNLDNVKEVSFTKDGIKIVMPLEGIDLSSIGTIKINEYEWSSSVQDVQEEVAKVLQEIIDKLNTGVFKTSYITDIAVRYGIGVTSEPKIIKEDDAPPPVEDKKRSIFKKKR